MFVNIVERYEKRILDMYLDTHPDADVNEVSMLIHKMTADNLRDVPCKLHNNIYHETIDTSLVEAFEWLDNRNPIISGNGTFFKQHSELLSPTCKMLEKLQKRRKNVKKQMYTYEKHSIEYVNLNTTQMSIKVIMNADYGGSGTPLSPFYSVYIPPATTGTAKAITTTLICCLEFVSDNDNQWAKMNNANEMYDMIFTVLEAPDQDRELIHDTFSVDEVTKRIASKTNNLRMSDIRVLHDYLSTLSSDELTKLMLAFNVKLVLTRYLSNDVGTCMSYFKLHPMDYDNATEETLYESGYGVKVPTEIEECIKRINKTVVDNCIYPFMLNDNEVRANEMKRVIVCVTDTDSLMVHFANYIDEFQAETDNFKESCLFATALGMRLFVEAIIPQMVSDVATKCRIEDKYYRDKFVFKNEFGFLAMALAGKKMYASSMFFQEGVPRDIHDIAITGLSFKKRDAAEFLEPIMVGMYDKYVLTSSEVRVEKILDTYYDLREQIKSEMDQTTKYFKVLSVKDISAYDTSRVLPDQMRGMIVWNNIMPDEKIQPMDRVIVIPLSFNLLEENSNVGKISEILRLSLIDNDKRKYNPIICVPEYYKEIPEWIRPVIDKDYSIDKIMSPFKQIFGLFDVNTADTRGGMIPSRMIYI